MNYRRWSTHLFSWFEIVCSSWNADVQTQPHDHGGAKCFVLLLWGEFRERSWKQQNSQLVLTNETSMSAPSFNYINAADIHDVYAVKKSYAIHLYYPKPKNSVLYPLIN